MEHVFTYNLYSITRPTGRIIVYSKCNLSNGDSLVHMNLLKRFIDESLVLLHLKPISPYLKVAVLPVKVLAKALTRNGQDDSYEW